jgi:xanthine/uracil/vitamin C permease (AzgA family)
MRAGLVALTGFGDTAVLMPLAAVMLLWLLVMRSPRGVVWWAITVAFCVGMTALLKVSFYGCPHLISIARAAIRASVPWSTGR